MYYYYNIIPILFFFLKVLGDRGFITYILASLVLDTNVAYQICEKLSHGFLLLREI
jgi:hypothetical protein